MKINSIKTFESSDCMNLRSFADDLFNCVQIDGLLSENSVVISLNAKFGMGKSHYLEMFKNYLNEKKYETILINSWKNDFCDEPLIAICSEIIHHLQKKMMKN
jgi:chromosomal replication initiation ATPase DnaA